MAAPSGGGELRIGGGRLPVKRVPLPGVPFPILDLGDIDLGAPIALTVVLDQDTPCGVRATGPLGHSGLQIVVATSRARSLSNRAARDRCVELRLALRPRGAPPVAGSRADWARTRRQGGAPGNSIAGMNYSCARRLLAGETGYGRRAQDHRRELAGASCPGGGRGGDEPLALGDRSAAYSLHRTNCGRLSRGRVPGRPADDRAQADVARRAAGVPAVGVSHCRPGRAELHRAREKRVWPLESVGEIVESFAAAEAPSPGLLDRVPTCCRECRRQAASYSPCITSTTCGSMKWPPFWRSPSEPSSPAWRSGCASSGNT